MINMARDVDTVNRDLAKKKRLAKETRKIRRIPAFVISRTKRKVTHNRINRNWRQNKLKKM